MVVNYRVTWHTWLLRLALRLILPMAIAAALSGVAKADTLTAIDPVNEDQPSAAAAEMPEVLIIELQTASVDSASEEFVELFNTTNAPIDLADWEVQYKSAAGSEWRNKSSLNGEIEPRGRFLVASSEYLTDIADDFSNSGSLGLAASAGNIRLVKVVDIEVDGVEQATDQVIDQLSWGRPDLDDDGNLQETADDLTPTPDDTQTLKRLVDEDGYFIYTASSFADWFISIMPTPASDDAPPEIEPDSDQDQPVLDPVDDNPDMPTDPTPNIGGEDPVTLIPVTNSGSGGDVVGSGNYPTILITELFPDPVSPQKDSEDEFIELYNPNSYAVNLFDWQLQSGSSNRYKFNFPSYILVAGQYAAFSIKDTGATLSNSGGRARLLDPDGAVVFATADYVDAESGQSFARGSDGNWFWSTSVTPSAANSIVVESESGSGSDDSGTSTATTASSSSSSSRNISNLVTAQTDSADGRDIFEEPAAAVDDTNSRRLIAGLLIASAGYVAWQYRQDAINYYHRLKHRPKK